MASERYRENSFETFEIMGMVVTDVFMVSSVAHVEVQ
jgi:hypothetical protein